MEDHTRWLPGSSRRAGGSYASFGIEEGHVPPGLTPEQSAARSADGRARLERLERASTKLNGEPGCTYSQAEFDRLPRPPCPVCGGPTQIDRIDVTRNARELAERGRRYIAGMAECPRGCNPVTGERFHGWTEVTSGWESGFRFRCGCGADELCPSGDRLGELLAEHQQAGRA